MPFYGFASSDKWLVIAHNWLLLHFFEEDETSTSLGALSLPEGDLGESAWVEPEPACPNG